MGFHIKLTTFEQIKAFVSLAAKQPFDIHVGNERQHINGKDLMGIFSLDFSRPLQVQLNCTADEAAAFQKDALSLQN